METLSDLIWNDELDLTDKTKAISDGDMQEFCIGIASFCAESGGSAAPTYACNIGRTLRTGSCMVYG